MKDAPIGIATLQINKGERPATKILFIAIFYGVLTKKEKKYSQTNEQDRC